MERDQSRGMNRHHKPRYARIAEELVTMITTGAVSVGDLLPTEAELCDRHGVSRHTAREALRLVGQMGLVERRQGSGTRVKSSSPPVQYNQFVQSIEDLLQYGNATRLVIEHAAQVRAQGRLAEQMQLAAGSPIVHLSGRRFQRHQDKPLCLTDIYLPLRPGLDVGNLLRLDESVFVLMNLLDVRKLTRVEQQFAAETVHGAQARVLGVRPGSAALTATRRYFGEDNRLLALAESVHAASRFTYSSLLVRGGAG
jgi:DNA-binding GntR family transcriptional regulator